MKIFSWNVNGIRANLNKGALQKLIEDFSPDALCLQEIKARKDQTDIDFPGYQEIWNPAKRPGYSGTTIFTKTAPLSVINSLTDNLQSSFDWDEDRYGTPLDEGRILAVEYQKFYLVTVYTPNSKRDLSRLKLREKLWDPAFLQFLKELEQHKPVIVCGDFNAAHTEIDLARPKDNEHNAGYTKEERQGITNLISAGFIDTFRTLNPDEKRYTWWTWRANARARNIGWRIDYFFISKSLLPHLKSAEIYDDFMGSDHCPISIDIEENF